MSNLIRAVQGIIVFCFIAYYSYLGLALSTLGGSFNLDTVGDILIPPFISLSFFLFLFFIVGKFFSPIISLCIAGILSLIIPALEFPFPVFFSSDFFMFYNPSVPLGSAFFVYALQVSLTLKKDGVSNINIIAILIVCVAFCFALQSYNDYIKWRISAQYLEASRERMTYSYLSESPLLSNTGRPIGLVFRYSLTPSQDYVFESEHMVRGFASGMSQNIETDNFNQEHEDDLTIIHHSISPAIEVGDVFQKNVEYAVTLYALPSYIAEYTQNSLLFDNLNLVRYINNDSLSSFGNGCIYWTYTREKNPPVQSNRYSLQFSHGQPLHTQNGYSPKEFYTNLLSSGMEFCPPS